MKYIILPMLAGLALSAYAADAAIRVHRHQQTKAIVYHPIHHAKAKVHHSRRPRNVYRGLFGASDTMPNMYVSRGFEPVYDYMSLLDPRFNPALRDGG
jgi:hypothetical protein